jgi:hypothetical protein
MIDVIPLEYYGKVVFDLLLFFTFTLSVVLTLRPATVVARVGFRNEAVVLWGSACFVLLLLLIGLRPISYAFGDMGNYYKRFVEYELGAKVADGDLLFESMLWLFAKFGAASLFFFSCTALYLVPLLVASRRTLQQYWPLAFFFATAQFDFYGYAVNGIRQGIAASLFVVALTYRGPVAWLLLAASLGFHKSLAIGALAYLVTSRFRSPKLYLICWLLALLITSIYAGTGDLIASTGWLGDRFEFYTSLDEDYILSQFSAVGFRLDFVLYSALPIAVGAYFILKRGFRDDVYTRLFNTYVACNAAWLLVMRIPYSNRFAYISWCLMGLVTAYPFVKFRAFRGQNVVFALLLMAFFLFTFLSHL